MNDEAYKQRRRKDARRNTERVVDAARRLMAEHGLGVSMEEIARHAGVGVGTLYRCFGSKDELVAVLQAAACADARHCLGEAARAEEDPRHKLRRVVVEQYRRSIRHAALLDARYDTPQLSGAEPTAMLFEVLHAIIREGQRQRVMCSGDSTVLALLCLQLLQPRAARQFAHGADVDTAAEQVADFLLRGLAT